MGSNDKFKPIQSFFNREKITMRSNVESNWSDLLNYIVHKFYFKASFRNALLWCITGGFFSTMLAVHLSFVSLELAGLSGTLWVAAAYLAIMVHWYIVYILAVYNLMQQTCPCRRKFFTVLSVIFIPLLPIALLVYNIKQRSKVNIVLLSAALLLELMGAILPFYDRFLLAKIFPAAAAGDIGWIIFESFSSAAVLLLFVAIFLTRDGQKISWSFLYPIAGVVLIQLAATQYNAFLKSQNYSIRREISQLVGRSVEIEDFYAANAKAQKITDSPLKGMLTLKTFYVNEPLQENYVAAVKLAGENRELMQAVKNLDSVEPFDIQIEWDENEQPFKLAAAMMPHLSSARAMARYMAAVIKVSADDLEQVKIYNRRLIKLRDLLLHDSGSLLISRMVGLAVEGIRIDALSYVVPCHDLTDEQWSELLGPLPDWQQISCDYMADETLYITEIMSIIASNKLSCEAIVLLDMEGFLPEYNTPLKRLFTAAVFGHFLRDNRHSLLTMRDAIKIIQNTPDDTAALRNLENDSKKVWQNKMYMFSAMLLPALDSAYMRGNDMTCQRDMLSAAVEIMRFYRRHGRLPQDLAQVNIPEKKNIYGDAMRYITGDLNLSSNADEDALSAQGFALYFALRSYKHELIHESYPGRMDFSVFLKPVTKRPAPKDSVKAEDSDGNDGELEWDIKPYTVEFNTTQQTAEQ